MGFKSRHPRKWVYPPRKRNSFTPQLWVSHRTALGPQPLGEKWPFCNWTSAVFRGSEQECRHFFPLIKVPHSWLLYLPVLPQQLLPLDFSPQGKVKRLEICSVLFLPLARFFQFCPDPRGKSPIPLTHKTWGAAILPSIFAPIPKDQTQGRGWQASRSSWGQFF